MITDNEVEKALHYMRSCAEEYGQAKGKRIEYQEKRKSVKAILMINAPESYKTDKMREAYAYSHEEYLQLLDDYREAATLEALHATKIKAAECLAEAWRTQQSTARMIDQAHR